MLRSGKVVESYCVDCEALGLQSLKEISVSMATTTTQQFQAQRQAGQFDPYQYVNWLTTELTECRRAYAATGTIQRQAPSGRTGRTPSGGGPSHAAKPA